MSHTTDLFHLVPTFWKLASIYLVLTFNSLLWHQTASAHAVSPHQQAVEPRDYIFNLKKANTWMF